MLLHRSRHLQAFAFGPDGKARRQGFGVDVRFRRYGTPGIKRTGRWYHHKLGLYWPRRDLRRGKGVITLEYAHWVTSPGVMLHRVTLKSGVRLKVMTGGPLPEAELQRRIAGLDGG